MHYFYLDYPAVQEPEQNMFFNPSSGSTFDEGNNAVTTYPLVFNLCQEDNYE